jgi:hypothetical protein
VKEGMKMIEKGCKGNKDGERRNKGERRGKLGKERREEKE